MNLSQLSWIHFTGIKGVGMSALACIAKDYGLKVTGSDVPESFVTQKILEEKQIQIFSNFSAENISQSEGNKPDLLVYTPAHKGTQNIEVLTAIQLGIPTITFAELLGAFFNTKTGISVCGTSGKTTTSAMTASIFHQAHQHASWLVGVGEVPSLPIVGRYDKEGEVFVCESDEYASSDVDRKPKFYYQHPKVIIVTSLAFDHPDVYRDEEHTIETFAEFIGKLPSDGLLVANIDSPMLLRLLEKVKSKEPKFGISTYGFSPDAQFQLQDYSFQNGSVTWHLKNTDLQFTLSLPGTHNALNATAAGLVGQFFGIEKNIISQALSQYLGSKRRFEKVAQYGSTFIYDDYAHHPNEVKTTLQSFREYFPDKKLVVVFQPHTYSRTKSLLTEFSLAFDAVDEVILMDIFASAREPFDPSITSKIVVEKIASHWQTDVQGNTKQAHYLPSQDQVVEYLHSLNLENTVVITMGAGDVYKVGKCFKFPS